MGKGWILKEGTDVALLGYSTMSLNCLASAPSLPSSPPPFSLSPTHPPCLQIGKGRILKEGTDVALLGYGTMSLNCLAAAKMLEERDISVTVADARFCKPLDRDLIRQLVRNHGVLVVVEEGSVGGFSAHVQHFMALDGLFDDGKIKFRPVVLPDRYIEHGAPKDQIIEAGLSAGQIASTVLNLMGRSRDALTLMAH
ncbi:unnamed protein product [Closterium sp. NIES-54]